VVLIRLYDNASTNIKLIDLLWIEKEKLYKVDYNKLITNFGS